MPSIDFSQVITAVDKQALKDLIEEQTRKKIEAEAEVATPLPPTLSLKVLAARLTAIEVLLGLSK